MSSLLEAANVSNDDIKLTDSQFAYLTEPDLHSMSTTIADIVSSAGEKVLEEKASEEIKSYFTKLVIQETGTQNVYNAWLKYKQIHQITEV